MDEVIANVEDIANTLQNAISSGAAKAAAVKALSDTVSYLYQTMVFFTIEPSINACLDLCHWCWHNHHCSRDWHW